MSAEMATAEAVAMLRRAFEAAERENPRAAEWIACALDDAEDALDALRA